MPWIDDVSEYSQGGTLRKASQPRPVAFSLKKALFLELGSAQDNLPFWAIGVVVVFKYKNIWDKLATFVDLNNVRGLACVWFIAREWKNRLTQQTLEENQNRQDEVLIEESTRTGLFVPLLENSRSLDGQRLGR